MNELSICDAELKQKYHSITEWNGMKLRGDQKVEFVFLFDYEFFKVPTKFGTNFSYFAWT